MLTQHEEKFIIFWEEKRKQNKYNPFLFGKGFSYGLIAILIYHFSFQIDWNKQVALNAFDFAVMPLAYLCILLFCAWFYNSFKYEQNEQLYQEILLKKKKAQSQS